MQKTMDSNDARLHWRDVLDAGAKGLDVVITRYNKPVSVVIDYEDYIALTEHLEDLRAGRRATATLELIRLDPMDASAYSNRGAAYREVGRCEKAIDDCNHAIRLDPKFTAVYYNRGLAYQQNRDYDKAIDDYTEAIRLDPSFAMAFSSRGTSYGSKSDYNKATADLTVAIRLDPKDAKAYYNRGVVYEMMGENAKAGGDYVQARKRGYKGDGGSK